MTTVRAASSATPSVALVPRRVVALLRVVLREVAAQEAVLQEARLRETLGVVAVAPAAMTTTITTHRAVVAEAVGDSN